MAALVSLAIGPIVAWREQRKRRLLAARMKGQNRVMPWADFLQAAEMKRGTLIVEGNPRKGPNFWWTNEDVRTLSPYRCSCDLGALFDRGYWPFREWCYERYANPSTGSAALVVGGGRERLKFAGAQEETDSQHPAIPTVLVTRDGRR